MAETADDRASVAVILCTCRPAGPMLEEALGSVAGQTYRDWTLLVVDDGSPDPDGIEAVARALGDVPVVHQARQGLAAARNVGLSRTRSRYVTFLDDDDVWLPERLARQVALLEARPDAVACHCQFEALSDDGTTTPGTAGAYDLHQLLRGERYSLFPTMVVRRADLDACGWFSTNFPTAEDVDLTYRLARRGPVLFCDEVLYRYRRHRDNMTGNLRASSLASLMALRVQHDRMNVLADAVGLAETGRGRRAMRRYWAENDWHGVGALWRGGQRGQALRLAGWTARTFPGGTLAALGRRGGHLLARRRPGDEAA